MKLILLATILISIRFVSQQSQSAPEFKIDSFTKVPDDFISCGDNYYLSEKDQKQDKLICRTDYSRALICVNNKTIMLKADYKTSDKVDHVFTNGVYILIIRNGPLKSTGDEDYTMKPKITIKYHSKVVWAKSLIGDGGC